MEKVLRLTRIIDKEIKRVGSANKLAGLINDANASVRSSEKITVTHKTLTRLTKGQDKAHLTLVLLRTLDRYLVTIGEGLQDRSLFEKKGILECLVEQPKPNIAFLLGSKPRREARRNDLSRWDTRSLAELLAEVSRQNVHTEFVIEDVLWNTPMTERQARSEPWYSLLRKDRCSVVAIGSPLANHASELVLSRMFGVKPFVPPTLQSVTKTPLPFYFAWPPRSLGGYRSAFALTHRELAALDLKAAAGLRANRLSAFVLDRATHTVDRRAQQWRMHGVIAAQRRSSGNVWLVVSGLTGPATMAAAELVRRVNAELPLTPGADSAVLWVPICCEVTCERSQVRGDDREVNSPAFVGKPQIWQNG